MKINLDECILLTGSEYMKLKEPIFKGQTRADDEGNYIMVFENQGILYKTHNNLFK